MFSEFSSRIEAIPLTKEKSKIPPLLVLYQDLPQIDRRTAIKSLTHVPFN